MFYSMTTACLILNDLLKGVNVTLMLSCIVHNIKGLCQFLFAVGGKLGGQKDLH